MSETIKYLHAVNAGDLISSLPGMQHVYKQTGKKAVIAQRLNMPSEYGGQDHPLKNSRGVTVSMTEKQWKMLVPLLEAQEYVESCEVWEGQDGDVNLNKIREGEFSTLPFGAIQRWNWYTWPAMTCDLSVPWITAPKVEGFADTIVLNFTERYRNHLITYYFLKKYQDNLLFAGTATEHEDFCKQWKLDIPYLQVSNFYELAGVLNSCKFLLSNQSMVYNIQEGLKRPRVLEVCRNASNCPPVGEHAYDFLHQGAVEFFVDKLINEL